MIIKLMHQHQESIMNIIILVIIIMIIKLMHQHQESIMNIIILVMSIILLHMHQSLIIIMTSITIMPKPQSHQRFMVILVLNIKRENSKFILAFKIIYSYIKAISPKFKK
ncbi:hypothetical protein ACSBR2_017674 [Camellia fascicularis]